MPASSKSDRETVALDTIRRTPDIITEFTGRGASTESIFYRDQIRPLPVLDPRDERSAAEIAVINSDSYTAARNIIAESPDARGKTAVLNLASDEKPAGGWTKSLSRTQEEALCYSSTLYTTLKPEYYPWPNLGPGSVAGVFSPGVVIFKDDLDHGCADLPAEDRCVVSVITGAAPRHPELTPDQTTFKNPSDLDDLRGKIRLVYRMAVHHAQEFLVLAAMGCGAYFCPPKLVASEMKSILAEEEFRGRFRRIIFAIYSSNPTGAGNLEIFRQVFQGGD
ncbi:hypothetical protein B0H17DRAFT_1156007 [Mycena rosella]|uniref:Microbial-type PARG catalytic domain-containing protein n=1 Tax=Mycena rosella TaxID=1033263 RepID=A0AAD7MBA4_MYCRO|nr:hypothetical protein B0H17DRAFT_1156007 [Mycena rosella]